jgi:hypothetical protein
MLVGYLSLQICALHLQKGKDAHIQRLMWTEIGLHAGQFPGYPASAGCGRLPVDFAAKLYAVTTLGSRLNLKSHSRQREERD